MYKTYCYVLLGVIIVLLLVIGVKMLKCRGKQERFTSVNSKHKICICMLYTDNIASYARLAERINRMYAEKHGYYFHVYRYRLSERAAQWDKVLATYYLLTTNAYDYVFWIDSDAYVNKQEIALEDVMDINADVDLHICDDIPNSGGICLINTGTFLIKNTPWAVQFLLDWWNDKDAPTYYHRSFHEQTVLDKIIKRGATLSQNGQVMLSRQSPPSITRIKIYPTTTFNSDTDLSKIDNYFIVHLMARPEQMRLQKMQKYLSKK